MTRNYSKANKTFIVLLVVFMFVGFPLISFLRTRIESGDILPPSPPDPSETIVKGATPDALAFKGDYQYIGSSHATITASLPWTVIRAPVGGTPYTDYDNPYGESFVKGTCDADRNIEEYTLFSYVNYGYETLYYAFSQRIEPHECLGTWTIALSCSGTNKKLHLKASTWHEDIGGQPNIPHAATWTLTGSPDGGSTWDVINAWPTTDWVDMTDQPIGDQYTDINIVMQWSYRWLFHVLWVKTYKCYIESTKYTGGLIGQYSFYKIPTVSFPQGDINPSKYSISQLYLEANANPSAYTYSYSTGTGWIDPYPYPSEGNWAFSETITHPMIEAWESPADVVFTFYVSSMKFEDNTHYGNDISTNWYGLSDSDPPSIEINGEFDLPAFNAPNNYGMIDLEIIGLQDDNDYDNFQYSPSLPTSGPISGQTITVTFDQIDNLIGSASANIVTLSEERVETKYFQPFEVFDLEATAGTSQNFQVVSGYPAIILSEGDAIYDEPNDILFDAYTSPGSIKSGPGGQSFYTSDFIVDVNGYGQDYYGIFAYESLDSGSLDYYGCGTTEELYFYNYMIENEVVTYSPPPIEGDPIPIEYDFTSSPVDSVNLQRLASVYLIQLVDETYFDPLPYSYLITEGIPLGDNIDSAGNRLANVELTRQVLSPGFFSEGEQYKLKLNFELTSDLIDIPISIDIRPKVSTITSPDFELYSYFNPAKDILTSQQYLELTDITDAVVNMPYRDCDLEVVLNINSVEFVLGDIPYLGNTNTIDEGADPYYINAIVIDQEELDATTQDTFDTFEFELPDASPGYYLFPFIQDDNLITTGVTTTPYIPLSSTQHLDIDLDAVYVDETALFTIDATIVDSSYVSDASFSIRDSSSVIILEGGTVEQDGDTFSATLNPLDFKNDVYTYILSADNYLGDTFTEECRLEFNYFIDTPIETADIVYEDSDVETNSYTSASVDFSYSQNGYNHELQFPATIDIYTYAPNFKIYSGARVYPSIYNGKVGDNYVTRFEFDEKHSTDTLLFNIDTPSLEDTSVESGEFPGGVNWVRVYITIDAKRTFNNVTCVYDPYLLSFRNPEAYNYTLLSLVNGTYVDANIPVNFTGGYFTEKWTWILDEVPKGQTDFIISGSGTGAAELNLAPFIYSGAIALGFFLVVWVMIGSATFKKKGFFRGKGTIYWAIGGGIAVGIFIASFVIFSVFGFLPTTVGGAFFV